MAAASLGIRREISVLSREDATSRREDRNLSRIFFSRPRVFAWVCFVSSPAGMNLTSLTEAASWPWSYWLLRTWKGKVLMIEKVIIVGAAGRDFHNFNVYFKDNPRYQVIAFTAAQIPNIERRIFPPELAGAHYPTGIPIYPEAEMASLIREHHIDLVAFSYSDISHVEVMHRASVAMARALTSSCWAPPTPCSKQRSP